MIAPKIAICVPSGRTWEAEMAMSVIGISRELEYDISIQWIMGSQITFQRNELVKRSLEWGATHLFWIDSDMKVPTSTVGELLLHDKDIVGATYLRKLPPYGMLGQVGRAVGRLKPATIMPGGCMLVKAGVYEKVKWPWYFEEIVEGKLTWQEGYIASEDYGFSKKAIAAGFEIWCDISLTQRIAHIGHQNVIMQLKEGHPDRVKADVL